MTPDEVVKKLGDMSSESNHNEFNVLASAISLIQDYQKLREKLTVEKISAIINEVSENQIKPFVVIDWKQNKQFSFGEYFGKAIVTYLQQPTEH